MHKCEKCSSNEKTLKNAKKSEKFNMKFDYKCSHIFDIIKILLRPYVVLNLRLQHYHLLQSH